MKAIDYRNETFESLRGSLNERRRRVFEAFQAHGPGTTRQIALKSGIDLLSLRPRVTELMGLGLIELVPDADPNDLADAHEGVYRITSPERWERFRVDHIEGQLNLNFKEVAQP